MRGGTNATAPIVGRRASQHPPQRHRGTESQSGQSILCVSEPLWWVLTWTSVLFSSLKTVATSRFRLHLPCCVSGILHALARHGYLSLAVLVFLEAIGMPMPAALGLAAAGAAAATGLLNPLTAIAVALAAILCGDTILFFVGRY